MSSRLSPLPHAQWADPTPEELKSLEKSFSRRARRRLKMPDKVLVVRSSQGAVIRSAMQYFEDGLYERWGIQNHPQSEIRETWSVLISWLRPLIGDRHAIEVYPCDSEIIDTAPVRWFWVLPDGLPHEYNLGRT